MALTDKSSIVVPKGFYGKANVLQGFNPQTENLVDLDVVRNTSATRINEQGLIENVAANVPRRDFLNGGCGELLVEPQRTNNFPFSNDFSNGVWAKLGSIFTANQSTSPDGTINAGKLVEDVSTGDHYMRQSITINQENTFSIFAKANTRDKIALSFNKGILTVQAKFDLTAGTITSTGSNITSFIQSYGNGWYRCGITSNTDPQDFADISILDAAGNIIYTGDGVSGIFIYGAQLEEGTYPTSYIPTTTAAVTRNKDLTAIDLSTEGVDEQYAVLFNVQADGGRLLMKSAGAGIDLDIKNSGKFAMLVDLNTITFKFPDNGQPQTELVYEKPADFRDIEFEAKLGPVRIEEVIWTEQLQPAEYNAWISGTVSSDFLETDWSVQTDFLDEFQAENYDYFPVIDTSSGTDFQSAWRNNQLTSFPQLDVSSGTNFNRAWSGNQLTSFSQLDVSSGTDFTFAWANNQLTSFPQLDVSSGTNFALAWRDNQLTSFPQLDLSLGNNFTAAWQNNQLTSFPQLDVSSGTDFQNAWVNNQLTSFPANMFDNLTNPQNNCFQLSWFGNSIDAQGVENILVSIDTSGANAPSSGVNIDISSNGDTLTAATNSAITSLKGKGWNIVIDGVAQ